MLTSLHLWLKQYLELLQCISPSSLTNWILRLRLWLGERKKEFYLYICVIILVAYPDYLLSDTQSFLTDSLSMSSTTAASIVNMRDGTAGICAIGGAIILDRYLSHYGMIISASLFYSLGLAFVTGGCYHGSTGAGINPVRWLVAIGLFLSAVGKLSLINSAEALSGFGAYTLSSVNLIPMIILSVVFSVLSFTSADDEEQYGYPYENIDVTPFLVATILLLSVSIISLFYLKCEPFMKPIEKRTAPVRDVLRVYCAAIKKRALHYPKDPKDTKDLYTELPEHNLEHTDRKRFLDKAAIIENKPFSAEERDKGWLCTVPEVEASKRCLDMVPMCMTFLAYGIIKSIGDTFFLDQANQMDTTIGKSNRGFPVQVFLILAELVNAATIFLYKLLISTKLTGEGEKFKPTIEYAIGMVLSTLCCTSASWTAMEVYEQHKVTKKKLSVFWLTPQFVAFGAMDGLAGDGIEHFYSGQLPSSLKGYALVFSQGIIGVGNFVATGLVAVTKAASHGNWFRDKKEEVDRLDRFYHLLTMIGVFIFLCYTVFAVRYKYRDDPDGSSEDVENRMRSAQETQNLVDTENTVRTEELHDKDQEIPSPVDMESATTSVQSQNSAEVMEPDSGEETIRQRRGYMKLKTISLIARLAVPARKYE